MPPEMTKKAGWHKGGARMKMPGPDSGIIRFLTTVCDLIFLNVIFVLACATIVCMGAAVTALYSTVLGMLKESDRTPVRDFLRNLQRVFTASTPAALLLFADIALLAVLYRALYAETLLFSPELFVLLCMGAVALTAVLSYLFPLIACFENRFCRHLGNAARLALANLPVTFFVTAVNLLPVLTAVFLPRFIGPFVAAWLVIGAAGAAWVNLFYLRRIFGR